MADPARDAHEYPNRQQSRRRATISGTVATTVRAAVVLLLFVALLHTASAHGEEPSTANIAARVNGHAIPLAELRATIYEALGLIQSPGHDAEFELPAALVAATLERAIDRRLVADRLARVEKLKLSAEELAAIKGRFTASLSAQKSSSNQFQAERGWSDEDLTQYLTWRTIWSRYLERELTSAALESYFKSHRANFDGTQVRVSHLLLRWPANADDATREKRLAEASAIRAQIEAGKESFADAVRKYSESPSRDTGGDQGFLPRRGVMVEPFSRAAFALKPGETSPPVVTPFGVHLIHCTEIKRGTGGWSDARDELTRALADERFASLAKAARSGAKIEYLAVPAPAVR